MDKMAHIFNVIWATCNTLVTSEFLIHFVSVRVTVGGVLTKRRSQPTVYPN